MTTEHPVPSVPERIDHWSSQFARNSHGIYRRLRSDCPVFWNDVYDGFWLVTGREEVSEIALDDETFSSRNDAPDRESPYRGIGIPPKPIQSGIMEMDQPRFGAIRRELNRWFSPKVVESRAAEIEGYVAFCIDQIIERGGLRSRPERDSAIPQHRDRERLHRNSRDLDSQPNARCLAPAAERQRVSDVRIHIDRSKCQGHAQCYAQAPDIFELDDEGYLALDGDLDVPDESMVAASRAVASCPERVFRIGNG
jgi:ferredoxin